MTTRLRMLLCGDLGGTNVGESFYHAADDIGWDVRVLETRRAFTAPRLIRMISWHLFDHRPPGLWQYNRWVCSEIEKFRPQFLLSTGVCAVTTESLKFARKLGVATANYSTDDPWNPSQRSRRFLNSIQDYDHIFTPRRANHDDFVRAAARSVHYLPFAYDPRFSFGVEVSPTAERPDVLFVGGGDRDRIPVLRELVRSGIRVRIHGSHWEADSLTRSAWRGQVGPGELRVASCAAAINLILVRRANRDGHVMRSFEAAACGGCLLVEDTMEHRKIFADTVTYFRSPREMLELIHSLLDAPDRRHRLAEASRQRITAGRNTYADRLQTILETACGA